MTLKEAAEKFVELTIWIREMSSPQLTGIDDAEEYRKKLLRNFRRIGEIAQINSALMDDYLSPVLESTRLLTEEEVDALLYFKDKLINPYKNETLDIPLLFRVAQRLYEDAVRKEDTVSLVRAQDDHILTAYSLLIMLRRIYPVCDAAYKIREDCRQVAKRLLKFLPPEELKTLPEGPAREAVLINSRYSSILFSFLLNEDASADAAQAIQMLQKALALVDDTAYRELAPDYNWVHHEFRTLQYLAEISDAFNRIGLTPEQLAQINGYVKRMVRLWESEQESLSGGNTANTVMLSVLRCSCLAGEISVPAYRKELRRLSSLERDYTHQYDDVLMYAWLPVEYILTLDPQNITKTDAEAVTRFYRKLIRYLHRLPNRGHLSYLISDLSVLLEDFIEVEDGIGFEAICMELLAVIHPPTYVHSLSVADLSVCLAKHLFRLRPELFAHTPGYPDIEAVLEHVWHAAACHDIGKLFIVETIITYGRKLYDNEFEWIRAHPETGAGIISKHLQTLPYAHVVLGHHRWYDGTGGYPESYIPANEPDRVTVDIVACADCLDAATDSIGRSYKQGKSLEEFIAELKEGSGTRYAPYLPELFEDETVCRELDTILNAGREEKYRNTYRLIDHVTR